MPTRPYRAARFDGFSFEAVYRVLSPYLDPVGLAFYVEPEFGPYDSGLELRAILQKNFLDDRLVLRGQFLGRIRAGGREQPRSPREHWSPRWRQGGGDDGGIRPGRVVPLRAELVVGLEFRNHNEFERLDVGVTAIRRHTAFFLGPNIHYGGERWFFTLSALRQLGAIAFNDDQSRK